KINRQHLTTDTRHLKNQQQALTTEADTSDNKNHHSTTNSEQFLLLRSKPYAPHLESSSKSRCTVPKIKNI
ncbi:MAG: hypothetical protein ACK559_19320, partial [bacterium]